MLCLGLEIAIVSFLICLFRFLKKFGAYSVICVSLILSIDDMTLMYISMLSAGL